MPGPMKQGDVALALVTLAALVGCQCGSASTVGVPPATGAVISGSAGPAIRGGSAGGQPVILYSDLPSAPPEAYVTFWGRDFGESGRVLVGNQTATVLSWSSTRVEVKLPAGAATGAVVLHTDAGASPPFPLRIHAGTRRFVATSGSDSADGSEATPFATIPHAIAAMQPGDVLYIRGGTYVPPPNESFRAHILLGDMPTGTLQQPIAIVSYPGETATIGDNGTEKIFSLEHDRPFGYLTFAKLELLAGCIAVETLGHSHIRIVANDVSGAHDECGDGSISIGASSDIQIIGNYFHDNGGPKLKHVVYLSGFGDSHDIEISYNRFRNHAGGRAIQMYGHQDGDKIRNIWIHSNDIAEIDRDAILVGGTDEGVLHMNDILVSNNVIRRAGRCAGSGVRIDNAHATNIRIMHNTLVSNGMGNQRCDESLGERGAQISVEHAQNVEIMNNILVAEGRAGLVALSDEEANVHCSRNLYSGRGSGCPSDDAPILGAPGFAAAAAFDFRLQRGSPAIDAAGPTGIRVDALGISRPSGDAPDVGAFELSP